MIHVQEIFRNQASTLRGNKRDFIPFFFILSSRTRVYRIPSSFECSRFLLEWNTLLPKDSFPLYTCIYTYIHSSNESRPIHVSDIHAHSHGRGFDMTFSCKPYCEEKKNGFESFTSAIISHFDISSSSLCLGTLFFSLVVPFYR